MKKHILHVVGSLNPGGVETSLKLLASAARRRGVTFDFLTLMERGEMAEDLESAGSRIFTPPPGSVPRGMWGLRRFRPYLRELLAGEGYEVIHCHVAYLAGPLLKWAHAAGLSRRVAQIHMPAAGYRDTFKAWLSIKLSTRLLLRHATAILGVSHAVLHSYFGEKVERDSRFQILPAACDLSGALARGRERDREGGVVKNIIQVARFHPAKNHRFTLALAHRCRERSLPVRFILAGDGVERKGIAEGIRRLNLEEHVALPGYVEDVPDFLAREADLFILPSLYEGVPMALLEAQAVGLPCLVSDRIDPSAVMIPGRVQRLPLDDVNRWADHLETWAHAPVPPPVDPGARFKESLFDPERNLEALLSLYESESV